MGKVNNNPLAAIHYDPCLPYRGLIGKPVLITDTTHGATVGVLKKVADGLFHLQPYLMYDINNILGIADKEAMIKDNFVMSIRALPFDNLGKYIDGFETNEEPTKKIECPETLFY